MQYVFFEKKVYSLYNGVWGKAPETGEFSQVTLQSVRLLLTVSCRKNWGSRCTSCSPNNFVLLPPVPALMALFTLIDRKTSQSTKTVYNNTHRSRRRQIQKSDKWHSYNIPCTIKIVHLCLIWCRVVRSRNVHPCYLVLRCPVLRCQSQQF